MALALDETEERSKSSAIVRFVCLSLAGGLNFMTSLVRFVIHADLFSGGSDKYIVSLLLQIYDRNFEITNTMAMA